MVYVSDLATAGCRCRVEARFDRAQGTQREGTTVNRLPSGTSVNREPLLSRRGALQMGLTAAVGVGAMLDLGRSELAAAHPEAHSASADITVNMRTFVQNRTFDHTVTS